MKKPFVTVCLFLSVLIFIPCVAAQETLKGQSLNGSTGLYSIPTGRIGWERTSDLGLDFGYRAIINDSGITHIPSVALSLFKWIEISTALDLQPRIDVFERGQRREQRNEDLLFGLKIRLPTNVNNPRNPAVALGLNAQLINFLNNNFEYKAFQPYIAITYLGAFFAMPAETTVVIGKTFYHGYPTNNTDVDFGMGFDLVLFPDVFGNFVHWIIDIANFDYSDNSWPNNMYKGTGPAWYRGIVNTGIRVDLASIPALKNFKFVLDFAFNDLFDQTSRSFTIGAVFGFSIK
ncbi:MAG: hypothetical protein FWG99_07925 [Treponema sp.]|nr:hypothetical protein [Treponema sp.]